MKIGILTFQRSDNLGAALQCYSLQQICKKYEINTQIVDYIDANERNKYRFFRKGESFRQTCFYFLKNLFSIRIMCQKRRRYNAFREKLDLTAPYSIDNLLKDGLRDYDLVITGSDQVWNQTITKDTERIYYLNFPGDFRKAAYAVSLGNLNQAFYKSEEFAKLVSTFDCLSFREEDAMMELSNIYQGQIRWCLDPTLLFETSEWLEIVDEVRLNLPEKYIYLYILEYSEDLLKIADDLAYRYGMKIVCTSASLHARPHSRTIYMNGIGPAEFLHIIAHASFVVSSSFHAMALSIIFDKPIFALAHHLASARQTSLLQLVAPEANIFHSYVEYMERKEWEHPILYDKTVLMKKKKDSLEFLEEVFQCYH